MYSFVLTTNLIEMKFINICLLTVVKKLLKNTPNVEFLSIDFDLYLD
jgi:hypothetical protein